MFPVPVDGGDGYTPHLGDFIPANFTICEIESKCYMYLLSHHGLFLLVFVGKL